MLPSSDQEDLESVKKFVNLNYHRIRECDDYKLEYKECNSLKGRFHQYFIFGQTADCTDLLNKWKCCKKCLYKDDYRACKEVILLENKLRETRMKNHLANDVWERRERPPENWDSELPDWAKEKMENSFSDFDDEKNCVIF